MFAIWWRCTARGNGDDELVQDPPLPQFDRILMVVFARLFTTFAVDISALKAQGGGGAAGAAT